ncbi:MAG: serine hydrolase [Lachnospiraceae bacterium]|nr:serine hydrolase [Lachnospiraceae bacterium]
MKSNFTRAFALIMLMIFVLVNLSTVAFAKKKKTNEVTEDYLVTDVKAPNPYSYAVVLMDAKTGEVLYSKNGKEKVHPASTTKVMTALVALENNNLNDVITYTEDEVLGLEEGSSSVAIDVGEQITVEQSLYAALLESANECCNGLAVHTAGSVSAFAEMMNDRAKELGCVNTHFVNANGLYDDNHYTCAYDLALMTRAAVLRDDFKKISGTKVYEVPPTNKQKETRYWRNHHKFINNDLGYNDEIFTVEGGKTGYTVRSSYSLVTFAKSNSSDIELICITMECDDYGVIGGAQFNRTFTDANAMFKWGFENYSMISANLEMTSEIDENDLDYITKAYTTMQSDKFISFSAESDCEVLVSNSFDESKLKGTLTYEASGNAGSSGVWGRYEYTNGDTVIASTNILYSLNEDAIEPLFHIRKLPTTQEKINRILIYVAIGVFALAALYVIVMLIIRYQILQIFVRGRDVFDMSHKSSYKFKSKKKRIKKQKPPDLGYLKPSRRGFRHKGRRKNKDLHF